MNMTELAITTLTLGGIFSLMTMGLNLQLGMTGLINFGVVAYVSVGGYTYAVLVQPPPTGTDTYLIGLGQPMWIGVVGAVIMAVLFALVTGWPCLRLRGEYLALTTFAFAEVFGAWVTNEGRITNGTLGFFGLPQPFADQIPVDRYGWFLAWFVVGVMAIVFVVLERIRRSPYGRVLNAVRDDEIAATLAGKRVRRLRLQSFLVGAAIFGLGGAAYTWFTTVVSPGQFSADVTFTAFIALTLGGIGSNIGAVLGALILVGFQELVRVFATNDWISTRVGAVEAVLEGLLLLVLLRLSPSGLAGVLDRSHRRRPKGNPGPIEPAVEAGA